MQNSDDIKELDQSISQLLPDAKTGCENAQSQLFQQLRSYYLFVAKQNIDKDLQARINPSDVVQETMFKAANAIGSFRGTNSSEFRAWLKVILTNEINELRRKHRLQKRDVRREVRPAVNDESRNVGLDPIDNSLTPQSRAVALEELKKLRSYLSNLSPDHQTVIQLRSLERKSFEEVGELMGRSTEAASKLWYRAIGELRKAMNR